MRSWIGKVAALAAAFALVFSALPARDASAAGEVPVGQLTRRGLSGDVVSKGASEFQISTQFGNVTIDVSGSTVFRMPPDGEVGFDSLSVGDRVAVLLDRSPAAPPADASGDDDEDGRAEEAGDEGDDEGGEDTGEDAGDDETGEEGDDAGDEGSDEGSGDTGENTGEDAEDEREETDDEGEDTGDEESDDTGEDAEPVTPAPSFRSVTALKVTIIPSKATREHVRAVVTQKGNGKVKILGEDGSEEELDGEIAAEEGSDVVLVTRGRGGANRQVTTSEDPTVIESRIDQIREQIAARDAERAERLDEKRQETQERREQRLQDTVDNAPEDARGKAEDAKERAGNQGGGNSGGGNSGGGNQGGGNPNQGGGNSNRGGGNNN